MIKFYNQYLADQQDGFVSNINSYVESKLKGHPEEEIKEVLKEIETLKNEGNYFKDL